MVRVLRVKDKGVSKVPSKSFEHLCNKMYPDLSICQPDINLYIKILFKVRLIYNNFFLPFFIRNIL